ncbi:hypothetical protein NC652_038004 [Populus alba x Populus x berolinensis]|nr:hypothetical protein NC652_038004 [Populus alba x Populus x berolinensis]
MISICLTHQQNSRRGNTSSNTLFSPQTFFFMVI